MKVSTLRESTAMASPLPREMEEELVPAGSEPGDPRTKPPVKPKPRALPSKPALPAKPSLLVPVGPRPPRGPLAELPSARKMNMLAGPQPYGGSKRPLPFAPRPTAETPPGGEVTQEPGKEEAEKEELPPFTPPARCAAPGGVRKAPAPFRLSSERFASSTVEEILAKMEQPRKEFPASPDRLWGSRLTFNHDGSSRYGPRTYGTVTGPKEEDEKTPAREWPQEGPAESPAEYQKEQSKISEERSPASSLAVNGDLAKPANSDLSTDGSKPWVSSSPGPVSKHEGSISSGLPTEVSGSAPESPQQSFSCHSEMRIPDAQSPAASEASLCFPATPASASVSPSLSSSAAMPVGVSCHSPTPGLPLEATSEAQIPSSPLPETVSVHKSPEQPLAISPRPLVEGGELLDLVRTFPYGEEAAPKADADPRPGNLGQRRFSEGVLRPPNQDQGKLGGSLAALPQAQGSQSALDRPFGSGTESNWSLSQSFEWTFPTRPSGLGVWRLDSPPPSPITEASEAAEAAEASNWAMSGREAMSQPRQGALSSPEGPQMPISGAQGDDPDISPPQKNDRGSLPQPLAVTVSTTEGPLGAPLLQAEERYEDLEPLPGQESALPQATREAVLPMLEPVLGQQQPAPSDQPCVLFADAPDPGQALAAEEESVTLAQAETTQPETTQPRTGSQDSCRASPESVGPENSSRWLDDLLASPPPVAGSARRGAGSELTDAQSPSTCSEGLLGWSQKDLQSEFGVVADPPPSRFSPSRWSQGASQDYGFGGTHPRGDPGLGERDWSSKYGQGAGEGSSREWASRCSFGQEEIEVSSSQDQSEVSSPGGLTAHEWAVGQPAQSDTQRQDTDVQQWEFRKEDSQGSYSRQDAELQDQEFGKRDSLASYSSKDASLQDWEFGKRESLGAYTSQDAVEPCQESGMKEHLGGYSSQDAEEQDREFEKRDSSLGIYSSRTSAQHQDQEFGTSAWMQDYGSDSSRTLSSQDRGFGMPALSPGFSPEEARQQDEEFEKKTLSGDDRLCEASRDADRPEEGESGCLFSPSTPKLQEGLLGQRDQNNWQDSDTTQEDAQLQGRPQTGGQSPADADLQDGEIGKLGWAGEFSLGVTSHSEEVFRPGRQDWSGELCMEATDRSRQFGIIGNDRMSGAGLSPSGEMGGSHFVPPGETASGPVDWTDQLGLRNLEVSSCVDSGGSSETRENTMGQMSWSDSLSLRDGDLASHLATGGSDEPRGMGVGEKDWTSSVGVRSRDLPGVEEVRGQSQTRESGVGQPDWSGMEAGEFLKTRERGVGQADWTPDLGLRNMAPAAGCSPAEPRELGVGQVDWSDNLGLRNLEVPCDLESGGGSRGCGVGQMDWGQDLGLRHMELSRALSESREHGVGRVSPVLEPGIRDSGGLSTGLETRDPLEVRELGVGETSGPETQGADHNLSFFETHPEDPEMETEGSGLGVSSSRCLARSPPSGSQGLLEEMLAASNSKAATGQESAVLGLRVPLEEEGATAGAGQRESSEPSREPLPSWRPQPDGEASRMEEVDGTWDLAGAGQSERGPAPAPRRSSQGPLPSCPSEDFSFIEDTEVLDSAIYRSRANLGRKRGHRAPAIRPGGTLGLSELADSDARLFQDSTEPRSSRVPSSDEEVVEEPQSRRTRMSLGTKGLKVNLFPGLSPSALKAKLRSRNRSAEEGEVAESKSSQKESAVQRSKSCKVPGLGKPLALPPKPEKSSGSEGSSPNWLQALKLKKKRV